MVSGSKSWTTVTVARMWWSSYSWVRAAMPVHSSSSSARPVERQCTEMGRVEKRDHRTARLGVHFRRPVLGGHGVAGEG